MAKSLAATSCSYPAHLQSWSGLLGRYRMSKIGSPMTAASCAPQDKLSTPVPRLVPSPLACRSSAHHPKVAQVKAGTRCVTIAREAQVQNPLQWLRIWHELWPVQSYVQQQRSSSRVTSCWALKGIPAQAQCAPKQCLKPRLCQTISWARPQSVAPQKRWAWPQDVSGRA